MSQHRELKYRKPPQKRNCFRYEAYINNQKCYIQFSEYEDGTLCDIFVDGIKIGSTMKCLINSVLHAVNIGIRRGIPINKYVAALTGQKFEPCDQNSSSILDMIFNLAKKEYGK